MTLKGCIYMRSTLYNILSFCFHSESTPFQIALLYHFGDQLPRIYKMFECNLNGIPVKNDKMNTGEGIERIRRREAFTLRANNFILGIPRTLFSNFHVKYFTFKIVFHPVHCFKNSLNKLFR